MLFRIEQPFKSEILFSLFSTFASKTFYLLPFFNLDNFGKNQIILEIFFLRVARTIILTKYHFLKNLVKFEFFDDFFLVGSKKLVKWIFWTSIGFLEQNIFSFLVSWISIDDNYFTDFNVCQSSH